MITKADLTHLLRACLAKGWQIGLHRHPKTKANWNKPPRRSG